MSAPSAINNARQIIIGATAPLGVGTNLQSAAFRAAAGEVGIFSKEGTRLVAGTATVGREYVIAVSRGAATPPLVSDLIDGSKVTVANAVIGSAATEQVTTIGFNGATGLIADVATYAGELYKVSILIHQFLSGTDSEHLKAGYYQSQLTDGQAEIALGIAASVIKNFSREVSNVNGDKPIVVRVMSNSPGAAYTALTGNLTVTKGSALVSAVTAINGNGQAVGDYWRAGIGATDDVYKITALDTTNDIMTLDRAYQGVSNAALGFAAVSGITAALGAAANWGVGLTGTPLPFSRDKKRYAKCRFDVSLSESFGSTAAGNVSSASEGEGTIEAISQLENFVSRFMSESYEMGEPFIDNIDGDLLAATTITAVAGGGYSVITVKWSQIEVVSFQNEVSPKELIIATPLIAPLYANVPNGFNTLMALISPNALVSATLGV